jgi:hypothetical protein
MKIPVIIEPISDGRFRARAGEPFGASAEGASADEATRRLETLLRQRLCNGNAVATIDLENGAPEAGPSSLRLTPLPADDWFFTTMREAITENRKLEDEAGQ